MNDGKVKQGLIYLGGRLSEFYEANKPHIFTGIGIGGTIMTGVLAALSGARSARKIDKRQEELGRPLTFLEKGQLCWTDALAPIAVCGATCWCDFKANRLFTTEIAKRTTMFLASEKAYEQLSKKTKEVLGEKKAKQIHDEVVNDKIDNAIQAGAISLDDFTNAPRVGNGTLYHFIDEYSMLPFWSNIDYITLQVRELQDIMNDLKPRDPNDEYYDKIVGVYYTEWLRRIGWNVPRILEAPVFKNLGWNKGYAGKHGADDDVIDFYTVPKTWAPGVSVTAVGFNTEPTNMRLGRWIKSSGIA